MSSNKDRLLVALSMGFFGASCLLFMAVLYDGMNSRLQRNSRSADKSSSHQGDAQGGSSSPASSGKSRGQSLMVGFSPDRRESPDLGRFSSHEQAGTWRARPPLGHLVDSQKTPFLALGGLSYQILGMSQDSKTGEAVIWVRSLTSQRVGKFSTGEALFGGPIRVMEITPKEVQLSYKGRFHAIRLGA